MTIWKRYFDFELNQCNMLYFFTFLGGKLSDKSDSASYRKHISYLQNCRWQLHTFDTRMEQDHKKLRQMSFEFL